MYRAGEGACARGGEKQPGSKSQLPKPNALTALGTLGVGSWELEVWYLDPHVFPFGVARERVLGGAGAGDHLVDARLVREGPLDRFFRRLVVVVVDLLVVLRVPVDEHAHQDAQVIGL